MLRPLKKWFCDTCNEVIESPEEAFIIWESQDELDTDFRIIHGGRCDDRSLTSSTPLTDYLGPDGLSNMLSSLSAGPIKNTQGERSDCDVNLDAFIDLIRRLHLPYYEEARRLFRTEECLRDNADSNEFSPYCVAELRETIRRYGRNGLHEER